MKPRSRTIFTILTLLCICLALSLELCSCGVRASSNPGDYVGEYVFMPANTSPGKFADFLVLRPDKSAIEIRVDPTTGNVRNTEEKWYLSYTTGVNVVIGDFSHPVENAHSSIKLIINGDLGEYYEKMR